VGVVVIGYWDIELTQARIAACLFIAMIGLLSREYLRSYLFAEEMPMAVLRMDLLYSVILLILTGIAYLVSQIGVATVFALMGASAALVSLRNKPSERSTIKESYRENWEYGKWALLGVIITHVQSYSYLYLLGALLSSIAVAEVSAAKLLLMPMAIMQVGWAKIAIPHGSKLRELGDSRLFFREQIVSSVIMVLAMAVYVTGLVYNSELVTKTLLTERYHNVRDLIVWWGTVLAINCVAMNASVGLQAAKQFKSITGINALTMPVTVGSAYALINSYGVYGSLISLMIGDALLAAGLWTWFARTVLWKGRAMESE
jgi:O-antigen/teichoic acid export membrane protein